MTDKKICGRCKLELSLEEFYFRADRGCLASKCKSCFSDVQRSYKARPEIKARQRANRAAWQRSEASAGRSSISDIYVKKLLTAKTPLKSADIPDSLVQLKRVQIAITRLLKDEK